MCGILGIINDNKSGAFHKELGMFKQMLIAGSLRGQHGTGIIGVDVDGSVDFRKIAGDPFSLLRSKIDEQSIDDWAFDYKTTWRAMIGHNRYATTGGHTTNNAHPFQHGRYTMVHNGTLQQSGTEYSLKKFEVDSENFCWAMNEYGIHEAIQRTCGAIATVVYDDVLNTIHLFRNSERPLFVAMDKFMGKIIFASELGMLNWICGREGWQQLKFAPLPVNTLFTINIDDIKNYSEEPLKSKEGGWSYMGFTKGGGKRQHHHQQQQQGYEPKIWDVATNQFIPAGSKPNHDTSKGSDSKAVRAYNKAQLALAVNKAMAPMEDESAKKSEENDFIAVPLSRRETFRRQREAKNKQPVDNKANDFQSVPAICGITAGQEIVFSPVDVIPNGPVGGKKSAFLLEGRSDDSPKLQIRFWCRTQDEALELLNYSYLKAKVRTLLWYTRNNRDPEGAYDIAWVEDPSPASGMESSNLGCIH